MSTTTISRQTSQSVPPSAVLKWKESISNFVESIYIHLGAERERKNSFLDECHIIVDVLFFEVFLKRDRFIFVVCFSGKKGEITFQTFLSIRFSPFVLYLVPMSRCDLLLQQQSANYVRFAAKRTNCAAFFHKRCLNGPQRSFGWNVVIEIMSCTVFY